MYSKIARNNVKRSFKDYTIYFLTLTFAVCIFYSFNSIESQSAMMELNKGQVDYVEVTQDLLSGVSVFVSFVLGGLIIYATNFLIKRRKKEFGIYMTLGMSKSKISIILFIETLIIGLISLIVGLMLGAVLSQGLSLLTANLFAVEMNNFKFIISKDAILKTIMYFGIIYVVVIIFNVFIISKYKLIDLLSASKKSENIKVRNKFVAIIILVLSIISLIIAYRFAIVTDLDFYDIRFTLSIILGIIGTLGFFYGLASTIFSSIEKNQNLYLNDLNVFIVRQITNKFNTNFISMTVICLMLFITIGILTTGLSIKTSFESSLIKFTPFDASLEIENKDGNDNRTVISALDELGFDSGSNIEYINIKNYSIELSTRELLLNYLDKNSQLIEFNPAFTTTDVISISDFNKIRKLSGKDELLLDEDEVYVASNHDTVRATVERFIKDTDIINIKNKEYKIKSKEILTDAVVTSSMSSTFFTLIVPDSLVINDKYNNEIVNLNFIGESANEDKARLDDIIYDEMYRENVNCKFTLSGTTRKIAYDASRGLSTIILFIAIYLGIVFLLSSAAVLALQQLTQSSDSKDRYEVLKKIGAPKSKINKSILIEVIIFFMLPLVLAIVHSIVGINIVQGYILAFGEFDIIYSSLVTAVILVVVYGGYLYSTYIGYKNIIEDK